MDIHVSFCELKSKPDIIYIATLIVSLWLFRAFTGWLLYPEATSALNLH